MKLTKGDRLVVGWAIGQMQGVNKTDARLVVSLQDHLKLDEVTEVKHEELDQNSDYEISDLQLGWIKDQMNGAFDAAKVPPPLARYTLALLEKVEQALEMGAVK